MMLPWSIIEGVLKDYTPVGHVDKAHSIDGHMKTVYKNARSIIDIDLELVKDIEINYNVLSIMVGFHDISRHVEMNDKSVDHSKKGAEVVEALLTDHDKVAKYRLPVLASNEIKMICDGIRSHRYSSNINPNSYEASVLQDADRLDSIGSAGLVRTIYYSERVGIPIHTPDIIPKVKYTRATATSAVNQLLEKNLAINADTFNTVGGKYLCGSGLSRIKDFVNGEIRRAPFTKPLHEVHLNRLK